MRKLMMILLALITTTFAKAQLGETNKTLSPYFQILSDDPGQNVMPLISTKADVNIAGTIADVTVQQVYKNDGDKTLEAIYVFPASTRAAVYAMRMKVGGRIIDAEIRERNQARKEYEQAKSEGKRASLLEQQKPNVFQMNVANILPGEKIQVEMKYTELLVPTAGVYEFVYPTVVGPRYTNQPVADATNRDGYTNMPYSKKGIKPTYTYNMKVHLSTGLPIQEVECPSHKVNINHTNYDIIDLNLHPDERYSGNKDFIFQYRLAGSEINSGMLLYEGDEENFFLMMVQPPKQVEEKQIPPREYIFVVDVSGSMKGFPLTVSKKLMKNLIANLKPTDRFNILLFAGGSSVFADESVEATPENLAHAEMFLSNLRGGGGTELLPALKRALALPRCDDALSRSTIVITDGYVSVEEEAFDLIRRNLDKTNMFTFGIGSGVNRHLIEGLAHVGMGEPLIVTSKAEADKKADLFRKYIQTPVLTQVQVNYKNFNVYDVDPISIPDVMAERPVIVFGKYRGNADGIIEVKGMTGDKPYKVTYDVGKVMPDMRNSALRYLWARERIRLMGDYQELSYDDKLEKVITNLGLKYNLMTEFTSFIAVDKEIIASNYRDGKPVLVKQTLPLPANVSNTAVGFEAKIKGVSRASKTKKNTSKKYAFDFNNNDFIISENLKSEIEFKMNVALSCLKDCSAKKGKLILKVKLNENGTVAEVKVLNEQLQEIEESCMIEKILQWTIESSVTTTGWFEYSVIIK